MPTYLFEAMDATGQEIRDEIEAPNEDKAQDREAEQRRAEAEAEARRQAQARREDEARRRQAERGRDRTFGSRADRTPALAEPATVLCAQGAGAGLHRPTVHR